MGAARFAFALAFTAFALTRAQPSASAGTTARQIDSLLCCCCCTGRSSLRQCVATVNYYILHASLQLLSATSACRTAAMIHAGLGHASLYLKCGVKISPATAHALRVASFKWKAGKVTARCYALRQTGFESMRPGLSPLRRCALLVQAVCCQMACAPRTLTAASSFKAPSTPASPTATC